MSRGTPAYENEKTDKETVVSARRLLQYFQLPDKNYRDISRYIHRIYFLRYFKTVMYLFHCFSQNPERWSVEPSLRNIDLGLSALT